MDKVIIREGKESDLDDLLALIRELAEYERCPDEVETGTAELREWGFGPRRVFGFYVAEIRTSSGGAEIAGIALYYYKYSTWKGRCLYLEDLIVTEKHRRKGYGELLFRQVLDLAKRENTRRIEWQVLDWNEPALAFYRKFRATVDSEWLNCRITDRQLGEI